MMPHKIATGVAGLDRLTRGGMPEGRTTLISGRSGAGKSITALQIASAMVRSGRPVIYVTAEERPTDIVAGGDALGFGTGEMLAPDGGLTILDVRRPASGSTVVTGEYDLAGLIARLGGMIADRAAKVVVIDSITALFQPQPPDKALRAQCAYLVGALEGFDVTVLLTAAAPDDYSRPTLLGVEDYVCDLVVILRNVVEGKRRRRSAEVHKYRRSRHLKGEYPLLITEHGVMVFPPDADQPAVASAEPSLRFGSGIAGLDLATGGGWLRESIIFVRGPSGSGKTILAATHAYAAALRGERVSYYGFQETEPLLRRNLERVGLQLAPLVDAGKLRLLCRQPDGTSMEDLLVELRREFDDFSPQLLVVDSLSCLEVSTSPDAFRLLVSGFKALLRARGASALLVAVTSPQQLAQRQAATLDADADAIVELDYTPDLREPWRTLRVLKMRGSEHRIARLPLRIDDDGLSVAEDPP